MPSEHPVTTPQDWQNATPEEWAALFQEGLAAFQGQIFPVGPATIKDARLLLGSPTGCDAVITAESFRVQHWPHYQHGNYFPGPIPSLLTQLLAWSGASLPTSEVRVVLDPEAAPERCPAWLTGRRLLWVRAEAEHIRIAVRDGAGSEADALRDWPEPFPTYVRGRKVFAELPEPLPCPQCGVLARRYRELLDGSWVCASCLRSFSRPPNPG
jgi:hypothetical protein